MKVGLASMKPPKMQQMLDHPSNVAALIQGRAYLITFTSSHVHPGLMGPTKNLLKQELSKVFRGSTQACGIETVENGNSRLR